MFSSKIRIDKELLKKAENCAAAAGYASVEEFVAHVLEKEMARLTAYVLLVEITVTHYSDCNAVRGAGSPAVCGESLSNYEHRAQCETTTRRSPFDLLRANGLTYVTVIATFSARVSCFS